MRNLESTILSQYANSPAIVSLLESMNAAIDPSGDIDNFLIWCWQVSTAQGVFLDGWGRIVGVGRAIATDPETVLTDSQFRSLILLKALSNISIATSPSINELLIDWIGDYGRAYVIDLGNMEILYQFEFALEQFQIDIITESGIFLRPAGVGAWIQNGSYPVVGFRGQEPFVTTMGSGVFSDGVLNAA